MQKLLTLNNIGSKGINSDLKPWELDPGYITSGKNFRIFSGSIRASGGSEVWDTSPIGFNAGHLIPASNSGGDYWLVMGNRAYAFDGSVFTEVTSAAGYAGVGAGDELNWTSCMLGQIPIVSNPQAHPEYWSPLSPGQILQPLNFSAGNTWQNHGISCKIIRSHKNFLFALDLTEGATDFPNSYRWSHPADINGLPFTWDETDLSGLAGKAQLGGDAGVIIDGLSLRDAFCIYSENAINILDYTGDNFVWRRRELSATIGLLSKNCVAEVKGKHFFLGDGDIVVNDGNKVDSIIHNKLRRRLSSGMSTDFFHNSYVVRNDHLKEVWFCVPEDGAEYPNIAYIYNWQDDSWALRDLPSNVVYGSYGSQATPTITWDAWPGAWDSQTRTWGSRKSTPLDDTIIGVNSTDSSLVLLDPETNDIDLNTIIERTDFPLEDHRQVTTITRVYPYIEGAGTLSIQMGSQDYAGSPVRWKPAIPFTPGVDRKIDVRTTGELHCWRVISEDSNGFDFSGMSIEYAINGLR